LRTRDFPRFATEVLAHAALVGRRPATA